LTILVIAPKITQLNIKQILVVVFYNADDFNRYNLHI